MPKSCVNLLVVENEDSLAQLRATELGKITQPTWAATLAEARDKLAGSNFHAVLLGLHLPDGNGIDLLREITARGDALPVIILAANAEIDSAIQALDCGAFDYLIKPCQILEIDYRLRHLARHLQLQNENLALRRQLRSPPAQTTLREMAWRMIQQGLRFHRGNKTAAARALGISLRTLYNKLAAQSQPPPKKIKNAAQGPIGSA